MGSGRRPISRSNSSGTASYNSSSTRITPASGSPARRVSSRIPSSVLVTASAATPAKPNPIADSGRQTMCTP